MRSLTNEERWALLQVISECSEIIHIATKTIEHGPDSYNPNDCYQITNSTLLSCEIGDLLSAIDKLQYYGNDIFQSGAAAMNRHLKNNKTTCAGPPIPDWRERNHKNEYPITPVGHED